MPLTLYLVSDARVQVVAGGDVSGRGDHREEERQARSRDVHRHYVRRNLLLDVRPENPQGIIHFRNLLLFFDLFETRLIRNH